MITARLEAAVAALEALPVQTPADPNSATPAEQDVIAERIANAVAKLQTPTP